MRKKPLHITPGGVAATILVLVVAGTCVRLGFWQLDRLEWRLERNRLIAKRLETPVVPLAAAGVDTVGLVYRRVELRGEYDNARSFVLAGRAHRGAPGVHVITPLRLEGGGGVVLVKRGWLPSADAASVDLWAYEETRAVRLTGMVLPFFEPPPVADAPPADERTAAPVRVAAPVADEDGRVHRVWFRPDAGAVRAAFPYAVADFLVQALPEDGAPARPARLPAPELGRGPHLGYAFQWFSFAAIALIGWGVLAVRRGGPWRAAEEATPR